MNRTLRDDDLTRLRLTADPQLTVGGRRLAYVLSGLDSAADRAVDEVVVSDLETGQQWRPRPAGCRSLRPRWSPGGDQLALLSEAGSTMQLWLWRPGDELARQLTAGDDEVVDLDWSPDGRAIAISRMTSRLLSEAAATVAPPRAVRLDGTAGLSVRSLRVEVVSPAGGVLWEVPASLGDAWSPRWSPAGGRMAFILLSDNGPEMGGSAGAEPGLWTADGRTAPRPVGGAGPVTAFAWGPSGTDIAYLGPGPRYPADIELRLFRCPAEGGGPAGRGGPVELAAGWDRSLGSTVRSDDPRGTGPPVLLWSVATGRIYFTVADGGEGRIGWADAAGGGYGVLAGERRACLDPSLDPAGEIIAFVSTDPGHPGDVHLADIRGSCRAGEPGAEGRRVTDSNPWLTGVRLASTRQVRAADGPVPVEGWLTVPDGEPDGGAPLVVTVHGGPHYPVGWRFCFETQRLAARGYAVLSPNPRGSGGYGREFAAAIRGAWGTADLADVQRLTRACVMSPEVNSDRAAITGVSYGGYLAMLAITRSAGFDAAISENGISNLLAEWGAEADGGAWLAAELGGPPWQRPDAYVAASPITAAHLIRTPLLLIHAELDQNCPIAQSEQMLCALRALGREAQLVRLPGEGHLVSLVGRPSRRLARAAAVNRWLDQHLGSGAGPRSARTIGEVGHDE